MSFRSITSPAADEDELLSTINTTPLVDVMLVMLIIFLITVPVVRQTVPVSLPQERNAVRELKAQTIEITVTGEGALYWNAQPLRDINTLVAQLQPLARQTPQPEVQVRGDVAARYALVGRVVDACQRAGISKVGFITEPTAR